MDVNAENNISYKDLIFLYILPLQQKMAHWRKIYVRTIGIKLCNLNQFPIQIKLFVIQNLIKPVNIDFSFCENFSLARFFDLFWVVLGLSSYKWTQRLIFNVFIHPNSHVNCMAGEIGIFL